MEQRICYGKNTPVTFLENLHFSADCPYRIRWKDFQNEDTAPLHYADTLELGVCCGIFGEVVIGSRRMPIRGQAVYVVPPGAVHATTFHRGNGHIYVLQISPDALKSLVNLELLFEQCGKSMHAIPCICRNFDGIFHAVEQMIQTDGSPFERLRHLLELMFLLEQETPSSDGQEPELFAAQNDQLRRILQWTQNHFADSIQLEQAAAVSGFSRNYFCAWFRRNTQTTYLKYLNQVRINHACRILCYTGSVDQACTESGFQDMSYFIQVFRKIQGCTPGQYVRNCKSFVPV